MATMRTRTQVIALLGWWLLVLFASREADASLIEIRRADHSMPTKAGWTTVFFPRHRSEYAIEDRSLLRVEADTIVETRIIASSGAEWAGEPGVLFRFAPETASALEAVYRAENGKRLAVFLAGELVAIQQVNVSGTGGRGVMLLQLPGIATTQEVAAYLSRFGLRAQERAAGAAPNLQGEASAPAESSQQSQITYRFSEKGLLEGELILVKEGTNLVVSGEMVGKMLDLGEPRAISIVLTDASGTELNDGTVLAIPEPERAVDVARLSFETSRIGKDGLYRIVVTASSGNTKVSREFPFLISGGTLSKSPPKGSE